MSGRGFEKDRASATRLRVPSAQGEGCFQPSHPVAHDDVALEAQRILGLYRRLVLLGRARLPLEAARKLVGPDCAYHLYFRHDASWPRPRRDGKRRARRRARRS